MIRGLRGWRLAFGARRSLRARFAASLVAAALLAPGSLKFPAPTLYAAGASYFVDEQEHTVPAA